jgi:DNA/RNA endonuclease YhcR with UshA esterase domain
MLQTSRIRTLAALVLLAVVCSMASAAWAVITPMTDIQVYTSAGVPASPFNAQVVTVRGALSTLKGTYNSGTFYVEDSTGGIQFFNTAAPTLAYGDTVEVTGTVSAFSGELQLGAPVSTTFINSGPEITPLALTVHQAKDFDGSGTRSAGDYELVGRLVGVTGSVALGGLPPPNPALGGQGTINLVTAPDTLVVFFDRDTHIDTSGLTEGAQFTLIGPMTAFNALLELKPRRQTDLVNGNPLISLVTPHPWTPLSGTPMGVSADIVDPNGFIASARLYYRNAGALGFSYVAMTHGGGNSWSATVPAPHTSGHIDYYVEGTDNSATVTRLPGGAPTTFLQVAVGTTPITTIQSTLAPGTTGSLFAARDSLVNVEGIITVSPGQLQTGIKSQYLVEDPAGGDWSGLFVFEGSGFNTLFVGDRVRISGHIAEFSGTTQIQPLRGDAVELVSFGNPLPPVDRYSTTILDTSEALENVIVRTFVTTVMDTIGVNSWSIKDTSDSSVVVFPAPGVTIVGAVGQNQIVEGMLDGRFGRNSIEPVSDDQINIFTGDQPGGTPASRRGAYIVGVSPNPFNPRTKVAYVVSTKGPVELAIYNQRGERLRTLVREMLDPGKHEAVWDGFDASGHAVGSGVYYARLRFATQEPEVVKLSLVK